MVAALHRKLIVVRGALDDLDEHDVTSTLDGDATPAGGRCREAAQLHQRLRADILLAAALLHDVGRGRELDRGPLFLPTAEGKLLGHVHLGLRAIEERAGGLEPEIRAEVLHAVAVHHDVRGARTAEASVLYHANALDAAATTRPVETAGASAAG